MIFPCRVCACHKGTSAISVDATARRRPVRGSPSSSQVTSTKSQRSGYCSCQTASARSSGICITSGSARAAKVCNIITILLSRED